MKKSSLYRTPFKEKPHSVQMWAAHYKGKTISEIVNEQPIDAYLWGLVKTNGGPDPEWRYVLLLNGKILDMRHVLVVGMKYGVVLGACIEVIQYIINPASFNQAQDYYSNKVGARFLKFLQKQSAWFQPPYSKKDGFKCETNAVDLFVDFIQSDEAYS